MPVIILVVSVLLEGILSNFLPINGLLTPLFTLVALIIIYPFFKDNYFDYYKYAFITGIVYDLLYTDTIIFDAIVFCFMVFIITKLCVMLSDNYVNVSIITVLCIIIYRCVTYSLLLLVGNVSWNFMTLLASIYNSLIINIIYCILLFGLTNYLKKKLKIR
jgi:rod shape-determining protein MreD